MAQTRFTCTLTKTGEPACQSYVRVTVTDAEGTTARGCPVKAPTTAPLPVLRRCASCAPGRIATG